MFIPNDNWVMCDICGRKRRRSSTRLNWKRQVVCSDTCYEPKHPQLTPPKPTERLAVKNPRPRPADVFVNPGDITADDL